MDGTAVVVTGLGLVTPAGIGVASSWERVLAGKPTATRIPELSQLPVDFACPVPNFDAAALLSRRTAWRLDRYVQFALVAAREAIQDADLHPGTWEGTRVAIVIGTGIGGAGTTETQYSNLRDLGPHKISPLALPMALPNMAAGQLAIELAATGPNLGVNTACASGATAIGVARDLLRAGTVDIALAGGTEAVITPYYVSAFARMGALSTRHPLETASRPFDTARDGFVMAEGAGMVVLETARHAHDRRARIHAHLLGYGASADAHHVTSPDPEGRGAEQAIRAALADAGVSPNDIDHVNAHGTSTPLNDITEAQVIHRVLGTGPAVTSTKGTTGHSLGAAGAIESIYTILAVQHSLIPPTANLHEPGPGIEVDLVTGEPRRRKITAALNNSFGFGGHNAALIMST
ncbi:beta-ketoacyl-[acyl-carrier-protein] synthase family protein [Streptomyces sp. 7N604]|uniref:beta-ketoacyl-[acyl-carrier-protein] synthase family protein n=1 Tax=Streptomyces sp. 7N604 TaxID=3457415 RepID=UPI003FD381A7